MVTDYVVRRRGLRLSPVTILKTESLYHLLLKPASHALLVMRMNRTACLGMLLVAAVAARRPLPAQPVASTPGCQDRAMAAHRASRAAEPALDPVATFDSAWRIIERSHWDSTFNGVSWTAVRDSLRPAAAAATTRGALRLVLESMVSRLRQSHFAIIPAEVADGAAADARSAETRPPGTLGFDVRLLDGQMVVATIDTGGPAWRAGIRTGWSLEAIGGCPWGTSGRDWPPAGAPRQAALAAYQRTSQALAGTVGDSLTITLRDGRRTAQRRTLAFSAAGGVVTKFGNLPPLNAQMRWYRVTSAGRTIGVIRFNIWMPVLSGAIDQAIDSLRTADGIVLDLRGNFGGVGGMSIGLAGHFIDSALTLGTMHQRDALRRFVVNPRRSDTRFQAVRPLSVPLALVVDELSVSTTEIFAGGMQALGRARVFGTQTAGEALPAAPERLPNGDILYHAISDFIGPTGRPLEGDGVRPDVLIPLSRRALLRGEDAALNAAIRWTVRSP